MVVEEEVRRGFFLVRRRKRGRRKLAREREREEKDLKLRKGKVRCEESGRSKCYKLMGKKMEESRESGGGFIHMSLVLETCID